MPKGRLLSCFLLRWTLIAVKQQNVAKAAKSRELVGAEREEKTEQIGERKLGTQCSSPSPNKS